MLLWPPGTPRLTTLLPCTPLDSLTLPSPPLLEDMLLLADMLPTLPELSTLPRDPPTPRLRLMLTLSTPLTVMLDSPTPDTLATPTTTLPTTMLPTVPTTTVWDMPLMPPLPLSRLLRLRPLPPRCLQLC